MNYALLFYQSAEDFAARKDPAKYEAFHRSFLPYMRALEEAGVKIDGAGLEPPEAAATIRFEGGQRRVQDGPFADTKEQLGGFFIIDVPDLDAALAWAARCPSDVAVKAEVRPALQSCSPDH